MDTNKMQSNLVSVRLGVLIKEEQGQSIWLGAVEQPTQFFRPRSQMIQPNQKKIANRATLGKQVTEKFGTHPLPGQKNLVFLFTEQMVNYFEGGKQHRNRLLPHACFGKESFKVQGEMRVKKKSELVNTSNLQVLFKNQQFPTEWQIRGKGSINVNKRGTVPTEDTNCNSKKMVRMVGWCFDSLP